MGKKGYLILENGNSFEGVSFGSETEVSGEVVFNTGMVGYPEGFTDPSYCGQILTMTYPLIGNYGVPPKTKTDGLSNFFESDKIQIRGLIVSSYIENETHWQSVENLSSWLKEEKVPALSCIDTRTLTKLIREFGVMKGMISFDKPRRSPGNFKDINTDNLVNYVSCRKPTVYGKGSLRILFIDCGVKLKMIKILLEENVTVIQVPWNYNPFAKENKFQFDALMVSNGPGDPKMVRATISVIKEAIERKIPILGVCLGNQILALASGANTYKLKYGHRGQNQPVYDQLTNRCFVTTQNHGFAVDTESLQLGWQPWFTNLNDSTNEGIRHTRYPFYSTQFHPEATPGPTDTKWVFNYFVTSARKWLKKN